MLHCRLYKIHSSLSRNIFMCAPENIGLSSSKDALLDPGQVYLIFDAKSTLIHNPVFRAATICEKWMKFLKSDFPLKIVIFEPCDFVPKFNKNKA